MKYRKGIAGFAIFAMQLSMLPLAGAAFTDVNSDLSAKLDLLIQKQIVSDNSANTFRPDSNLNRAEALKLILKASGVFKEDQVKNFELHFADISEDSWYTPYLKAGASFGIIKGYADNTIKLGNNVTKAELLTMMFRMHFALLGTDLAATRENISFNDVQPSDWSYPAVKWASTTFLIPKGISFDPNKELTRSETAEIIYAYVTALNTTPNEAFGKIALGENPERSQAGGGMGAGVSMNADTSMPAPESGSGVDMIGKIRAPEPQTNITFTFSGATLTDIPATMPVYKSIPKSTQTMMTSKLQDIVPKEFTKFFGNTSSLEVNNISFSDGVTGGYQYYLDLANAGYSIYEDWTHMAPTSGSDTYGLKTEPNAASIVQLAQSFLSEKGVSLEGYGPGEVDMSWKNYMTVSSTDEFPYPQYYTVNFPRVVDGKKVISEWGYYDNGISVGVNASTMKVNSVNGVITKDTIASNYDTKSWDEIVAGALKGGLHMPYVPYYYYANPMVEPAADGTEMQPMQAPENVAVTLTRAEQGEVLIRQYGKNDYYTAPTEFYVPVVVFTGAFPVPAGSTEAPQEVKIVVPTIKDDSFVMPTDSPIMYLKNTAGAQE